MNGIPEMLRTH